MPLPSHRTARRAGLLLLVGAWSSACGGKILQEPLEGGDDGEASAIEVDASGLDATTHADAHVPKDAGPPDVTEAGPPPDCSLGSLDPAGCICPVIGEKRACYPGSVSSRGVGICKDGIQACNAEGRWDTCSGFVTPAPEPCDGGVDLNCNGEVGCHDPTCAAICDAPCTDGATRSCYDGILGTENVGACHDGKQTCAGTKWGPCLGEVVPEPEQCCDSLDHDCNGIAGCYDTKSCLTSACCGSSACSPAQLDPGCSCSVPGAGSPYVLGCPQGTHIKHRSGEAGGGSGIDECCPCTATDCSGYNCCGEAVCAGSPQCATMNCAPLAPQCQGLVASSCDYSLSCGQEPCCECVDYACCPGCP